MRLRLRASASAAAMFLVASLGAWSAATPLPAVAVDPCGVNGVYSTSGLIATCTYSTPGTEDTFTVPTGITTLDVTAIGAKGGDSSNPAPSVIPAGRGAIVRNAALPVAGGSTLYVQVGAAGQAGQYNCEGGTFARAGGAFDGGSGGLPSGTCYQNTYAGGGGGSSAISTQPRATSVLTGDSSTDSRLVVAGGGGGGGGTSGPGGSAGNPGVVGPGNGGCSLASVAGGAGGVGGTTGGTCGGVTAGAAASGGTGASSGNTSGGGGGGGWFGGGGRKRCRRRI